MFRKKYFITLVMISFSVATYINTETILVSLGEDCQPAWRLKQFNLRHVAYPFDWLRTYQFDGLGSCVQESFNAFLNLDYLVSFGNGIRNKRYGIEFVHDFPTQGAQSSHVAAENENAGIVIANYSDYLPQLNNKYTPRIKRFLDNLVSNDEIIFLRTNIKPFEAQKFVNMINFNYPRLNYALIVIHGAKNLRYDWCIPRVKSFYVEKKDLSNGNGWWHENEWFDIFAKLNIYVDPIVKYRKLAKVWSKAEID